MRVLVACEFSGIVREAFKAKGHDAWSCDIIDTEIPGQHIKDDVLKHLNENWDLMIAHPPCTYLSNAGNEYFKEIYYENVNLFDKLPLRHIKQALAIYFILQLYNSSRIKKICIENPVGHLNTLFCKPNQIIQPFQFGEPYKKRTCLWLKNLPKLQSTNIVELKDLGIIETGKYKGRKRQWCDTFWKYKFKEQSKLRSKTFPGIAQAMAEQWG